MTKLSTRVKAFILGFTNAFTPIDYSEMNKLGDIQKRINKKTIRTKNIRS